MTTPRRVLIPLIVSLFLAPALSRAQVTVIGVDIEGLHQADKGGDYDKNVVQVKDATLTVLPAVRAFAEFAKCSDCCISPANKNPVFYDFGGAAYLASKPQNVAKIYIFSPAGAPAVSSLDALKGKRVGIRAGLPYGKRIEGATDFSKDPSPSAEASIKKLQLGRVDYLLEWTPDMEIAFQKLNVKPLPHAADKPIAVHEDSVLCKASPRTKAFLEKLDRVIK